MSNSIDKKLILILLILSIPYISILALLCNFIFNYNNNSFLVFLLSILLSIWLFIPIKVVIHKFYVRRIKNELIKGIISPQESPFSSKSKLWAINPIHVFQILGSLTLGTVFFRVESLIKPNSISFFSYILLFFISGIVTVIIFKSYYFACQRLISLILFFVGYLHSKKIARIYLLNYKPFEAFNLTERVTKILLTSIALTVPLLITFSEATSHYFYFWSNLLFCLLIVPFYVYQYRNEPIQYMLEIISYVIPIQICISFFVGFITLTGYTIIYYLRLWLSSFKITFPFNIPLIFKDVFVINPININLASYVEVIVSSLIISVLFVWLFTVLYKRSWIEFAAGIGVAVSLFGLPKFQDTYIYIQFENSLKTNLTFVKSPAFLIATLLPFIVMWIVNKIKNFFFSKTTTCYNCFYDDLKIYSNFCPFCGTQQANIIDKPASEISKIFEERKIMFMRSFNGNKEEVG